MLCTAGQPEGRVRFRAFLLGDDGEPAVPADSYRPIPQGIAQRSHFSRLSRHEQPAEMLVDPASQKVM